MRNTKHVLPAVLVLCMLLSVLPLGVLALEITEKPADGTTVGQPFAAGTGGSANFRIPGIVTLNDGTLIAACDARWDHAGDGAGLDTIVSVSRDNGASWTYTFANYLGDNGNVCNDLSTSIIDPGIGTNGTTAYLIADLWPAGIALNTSRYTPVAGENGFDDNDNLLLRNAALDTVTMGQNGYNTMAANADYGYYLDLKTLKLYKYGTEGGEDTPVKGYTVDALFNIVSDDGTVDTNLFFADSPYQPYPTAYLYMTTSNDGLNWSAPQLLNLKEENEQTLLVGPGNGTYDPVNDRMIFTAYEHSGDYERACLIWMDNRGNWTRSEDATVDTWSSEATSVVLDDGTVRMFYRDGYTALRYTDFVYDAERNNYFRDPNATEVNTAATVDYGCQLTSIKYSGRIDGKDVILVAGPTSYRRANGYIYAFLVVGDNSMELGYACNVTPDYYAYSCLTELSNGNIGLLYEHAGSALKFVTYSMEELTAREQDVRLDFVSFEVLSGEKYVITDSSGYYGNADISELNTAVATLALDGSETVTDAAQLGSNASYDGARIDLADCLYTVTRVGNVWSFASTDTQGNGVYLYPGNTTGSGYPNRSSAYANLSVFAGFEDGTFCIMSNDCDNQNQSTSYLYFDRASLRWDRVSSPGTNRTWLTNTSLYLYRQVSGDGSTEIPGYERITDMDQLTDGSYLVVAPGSDGNLYCLYPSTSTATRYSQIARILGRTVVGCTRLTFAGVSVGYTEVRVGSTVYCVTVYDYEQVEVRIGAGLSVVADVLAGDLTGAELSGVDTDIANVDLKLLSESGQVAWLGRDAAYTAGFSDIDACLYTLTANGDGTWVISAEAEDGTTVYIDAHAGTGNGGYPNRTYSTNVNLVNGVSGTIKIKDKGGTLHFWDTDAGKRHWDQCTGDTCSGHNLRWFRPAAEGETADVIAGYVAVTDVAQLEDGGRYLICGYANDTYYALHPSTSTSSKHAHVARIGTYTNLNTQVTITGLRPGSTGFLLGRTRYTIVVRGQVVPVALYNEQSRSYLVEGDLEGVTLSRLDTSVATAELKRVTMGKVSTGSDYSGGLVELEDCLYTFEMTDDDCYVVSARTAEGTPVYLNHYSTAVSQIPNCDVPGKIDVRSSAYTNMFKLVAISLDGAGVSRGLHFHTEKTMPHWNRCGNDTSAKCHEYLYRPVAEGETSSTEILGYVPVTDLSGIVDGGRYLIVHKDDTGAMYVLHPSADTSNWYSHVALLTVGTRVTFTGVAAGETSVTLPYKVFEIAVTAHDHLWDRDDRCQMCGKGRQYVKFITYTTSLGGNIAMNFYVELSRDLIEDPNAYMQFTFDRKTVKVPLSQGKKSGSSYGFSCPITSKNMSDEITAQVYNAKGAVGESRTMAVDTYCNWVMKAYADDEKTVNLMKAMLNYGASAQLLFDHHTDDLANAELSEADKALTAVDASDYLHSRTGEEEGIKPSTYTLLLDSETTIRVYFQLTGTKSIEEYTFTVNGVEVQPVAKDGLWYIEKTNIAAHRLDDMQVFTCGDITIHYGGLSYVNQVMSYYKNGTTFDMAVALYHYSQAAEAYIG